MIYLHALAVNDVRSHTFLNKSVRFGQNLNFKFLRMGNKEQRFEQGKKIALIRYIFDYNILFVKTCTLCFLTEKLLANKPFYAKKAVKGCFHDVICLKCWQLNQNETLCKILSSRRKFKPLVTNISEPVSCDIILCLDEKSMLCSPRGFSLLNEIINLLSILNKYSSENTSDDSHEPPLNVLSKDDDACSFLGT